MSVDAFDVSGAAQVAGRIETELIFAAGATERSKVSLAISAVDGPVIVAMVVHGAMAVEK